MMDRPTFRFKEKIVVKDGWMDAGRFGTVLGAPIFVEQWWVPVLWDDEQDPEFTKAAGIQTREP